MRTVNELRAIYSAIWHAKELLETLDANGTCINGFETPELHEMFFTLNDMNIKLSDMQNALEKRKAEKKKKKVANAPKPCVSCTE